MSRIPFHVVEDNMMKVPIILERKFCAKAKIVIDMTNRRISNTRKDGSRVDVYIDDDNYHKLSMHENVKVCCAEEVKLKVSQ